jgi:hypothetical protein
MPPPCSAPARRWQYRARQGEESSTVLVTRVETYPKLGEVVHVRIDGLNIANPLHPSGVAREIGHMPFAADAVRGSVTELLGDGEPVDEPDEGYQQWKEAFDRGEAGVFTITLAEAVEVMARALQQ